MSVRVAKSGLYAWDDTPTTGEREWREVHGFGMQVQVRILPRSRQSPRHAGVCACMLLDMNADHAMRVYMLADVSQEECAAGSFFVAGGTISAGSFFAAGAVGSFFAAGLAAGRAARPALRRTPPAAASGTFLLE